MYHLDDNIAAIASARGSGPRGIVRASGPTVLPAIERAFQITPNAGHKADLASLERPHRWQASLALPLAAFPLPGALYVWPTNRSYTGEPLVEWHTFGAPPLLEASLAAICGAGARLAEPGEFTLRAFLAGRLDLTQAEAVLGVIEARDERELATALGQLAGGLARPLQQARHDLLDLLVDLEAALDFVEEDISFISPEEVRTRLQAAARLVELVLRQLTTRGDAEDRPRVVLRGWPNTGKSSLLNALTATARALVSEVAGTTRDYLEAPVVCGPFQCRLIDTAGSMPAADGEIDQAAQQASADQIEQAELELFCLDASRPLNPWETHELEAQAERPRLIVLTKVDAASRIGQPAWLSGAEPIRTSSRTGVGLAALRERIAAALSDSAGASSSVAATARRSREALTLAAAALDAALRISAHGSGEELLVAEIRAALDALGTVVGAVYTDELLDGIFSRFCIGK